MDPLLKKNPNPEEIASATEHVQSRNWGGYEWSRKVNWLSKLQQYTKTYSYGGWEICLSS